MNARFSWLFPFHCESDVGASDAIGCVVDRDAQRVAVRR